MANNTFSIFVDLINLNEEEGEIYVNGYNCCCMTMANHILSEKTIMVRGVGIRDSVEPKLIFLQASEENPKSMRPIQLSYCPFCSARIIVADAQTKKEITNRTKVKNKLGGLERKFFPLYSRKITIDDLLKTREEVS